MSLQARAALVARLSSDTPAQSKADLLDPNVANTYVIAALTKFLDLYFAGGGKSVDVTSVRRNHGNDSSSPHSHESGDAWDMVPDNWGLALRVLRDMACAAAPLIFEVGLGGVAQAHDPGGWPASFDKFNDNNQNHIHVSAACR